MTDDKSADGADYEPNSNYTPPERPHPFYIGPNPDEAVCHFHDEMTEKPLILKKDGHIHVVDDGVSTFFCIPCCQWAIAKETGTKPEESVTIDLYTTGLVSHGWETISKYLVDVGPGEMMEYGVTFDEPPDGDTLPEWMKESERWAPHGGDGK